MTRRTLLIPLALGAATVPAHAQQEDDPYLWLEEVESPRALEWVERQNARTVAERKFSLDEMIDQTERLYRTILQKT